MEFGSLTSEEKAYLRCPRNSLAEHLDFDVTCCRMQSDGLQLAHDSATQAYHCDSAADIEGDELMQPLSKSRSMSCHLMSTFRVAWYPRARMTCAPPQSPLRYLRV